MKSASIGKAIIRAYCNHLLWFTIGAFAGAFEALAILEPLIRAMCK